MTSSTYQTAIRPPILSNHGFVNMPIASKLVISCGALSTLLASTFAAEAERSNQLEASQFTQSEKSSILQTANDSVVENLSALDPTRVFGGVSDWTHSTGHSGRSDDHHGGRRSLADKHAPAGLMGDHIHNKGEWMVEYKYMNMYMEDNRVGDRTVSDAESITIGGTFTNVHPMGTNRGATPTQMTMEMHMIHLMYGLTDDVTVYTMLMLNSLTMDHIRGPGNMAGGGPGSSFTTHNSGFGDTSFGALVRLSDRTDEDDDIILNLGFSVPTGDIFQTSSRPTAGMLSQPLPYPMRLGSGTFNARPGITWKHYDERSSHGLQFQTDVPLGRNYRNYSVIDVFKINAWYSHLLSDNLALSVRIENEWKTDFDGADPMTPNQIISTNVESFRGGYSLNLGLGVAALVNGHLLNAEFVPTLYQDLHGIQLETDWSFIVSWSKSF